MTGNTDIKELARFIKEECKNIVLMLGAGVSTSAGIPDFRSPKTGLYANLARLNLPRPEAVFDIQFFQKNPVPFYTLANELYPGKFRPTITHSFIRLLHEHGLLSLCLTQNIDTLERRAGVPDHKIVEAHGSFATQRCLKCRRPFDDAKMKDLVLNFSRTKKIPRCEKPGCNGLVKPDIVFFGESLPEAFSASVSKVRNADLNIVIGTSLTVYPFAGLALYPCPRALINLDLVGDFGEREDPDDFVLLGKCDDIIRELCEELGWEDELLKLWEEAKGSVEDLEERGREAEAKEKEREHLEAEEEANRLAEKLEKEMVLDRVAESIEKKEEKAEKEEILGQVAESIGKKQSNAEVEAETQTETDTTKTELEDKDVKNRKDQDTEQKEETDPPKL
ncbi:hypothetical protein D9758_011565 [Tetrapyrgos nigripes]|uniref:NAD-dependent protein deacetylase n=1 Tax=Tetrapyrgos nigripes TaxID=182062 RepID=A0A8H5FQE8_9AGAR|nr:hypothetical protein D9758_011565 [Tetrapyrgos nigripes]